jgi:hypothetical protein
MVEIMKPRLNYRTWLAALALVWLVSGHLTATAAPPHQVFLPLVNTSAAAPTQPGWLACLNTYRGQGNLPPVSENSAWSNGDWKHSRYTVKNDTLTHSEDPNNPWYTPEGAAAAQNGNVMASSSSTASDAVAIDAWISGPFHALGILDPALSQVGFGSYREANGGWQMAATLDVLRGLGRIPAEVVFPVFWPQGNAAVPLGYYGGEMPDPLTSCPGFHAPVGLPLIMQVGSGNRQPVVTAYSFWQGSSLLEACVFTELTYTNPNSGYQSLGRAVLASRDAIVLIPRQPLTAGATYTIALTVDGQDHSWSFTPASGLSAPGTRLGTAQAPVK